MTTTILNKTWKVKDLQLIASTKVVKELVSEYKKDANCRPYDFVSSEKISDLEKASFINAILN
jgi:hypothetical protein